MVCRQASLPAFTNAFPIGLVKAPVHNGLVALLCDEAIFCRQIDSHHTPQWVPLGLKLKNIHPAAHFAVKLQIERNATLRDDVVLQVLVRIRAECENPREASAVEVGDDLLVRLVDSKRIKPAI